MAGTERASGYEVLYEVVHGSVAFGLDRTGSDVDHKGVIIGPAAWYLGHRAGPEQVELSADHVRYDLRKFCRLAADGNPVALEMLWVDRDHVVACRPAGERLRSARRLFLSQRAADRFVGYASDQLRRIRSHRAWLLNPPAGPPQRAAFGLPDRRMLARDQQRAAETLVDELGRDPSVLPEHVLDLLARERRYDDAKRGWEAYRRWQQHRNPARAELEARFGYDTKHAMHLVRLLRMGVELVATGELAVRRPDREELLAVRDGAWAYDELVAWAEQQQAVLSVRRAVSPLPAEPDEAAIEALCVSLIREAVWGR
jgi:hypothetical protein